MADIFISYSHENKDAARILAEAIEKKGFQVWWDRDLIAGDDYTDIIENVLDGAKAIIVLWSDVSRKSHWVRDEAAVGRDRNRLLPVVIDTSTPPLGFRQIHTVSLHGWNGVDEEPLEDIYHGLNGLVSGISLDIKPEEQTNGNTNPFGAAADTKEGPEVEKRKILAGVNATPNNRSITDILKGEKKQRTFMKTFWWTSLFVSLVLSAFTGVASLWADGFHADQETGGIQKVIFGALMGFMLIWFGLVIGRFMIMVGRRLSKRKTVKYFDSVTTWILVVSGGVGALASFSESDPESATSVDWTTGDAFFFVPMMVITMVFPIFAFWSIPIGFIKGIARKNFADGK
jgi:hypothetical protein